MKKKIFSSIFIVAVTLIVVITSVVTYNYYSTYVNSKFSELKEESQLVIKGVELNGKSYFDNINFDSYRVTWINSDGNVIYDSSKDDISENHLERQEVKQALDTGYGEAKRYSSTILKESIYVAYKINDGTIIRLSCVQNSIFYLIVYNLYPVYFISFIAFVVALILSYVVSKKIVDPLNNMNLENPSENIIYPEIEPLISRITSQRNQLLKDKEEIEKTSLLRQEFTSNVTHEMKTPLHVIAGYSELLKEGLVKDSKIKEFAGKIYIESYRMTKLVDDILELSKLDNGLLDEDKQMISLDAIANNVIDSLQLIAKDKNITINKKLDVVDIYGAPNIIHSLVYNLIDNAIKYNKDNGQIDVIVEKEYNRSTLTVTDTGIGMKQEDLDRIFERFYRVDKSHSREIGGTGLGLSIVKHAAIVHNAKIEVESTLNEGSTFKVIF